jgi:hypothetical protein
MAPLICWSFSSSMSFGRPRGSGDVPQPRRGQVEGGLAIRECADHARASPDLAQESFEWIVGAHASPVLCAKDRTSSPLLPLRSLFQTHTARPVTQKASLARENVHRALRARLLAASECNRLCRHRLLPKSEIRSLMHAAGLCRKRPKGIRAAAEPHSSALRLAEVTKLQAALLAGVC